MADFHSQPIDAIREIGYQRGMAFVECIAAQPGYSSDLPDDYDGFVDELAHRADELELADRSVTPFEHFAASLNRRDDADMAWAVFDEAVYRGAVEAAERHAMAALQPAAA